MRSLLCMDVWPLWHCLLSGRRDKFPDTGGAKYRQKEPAAKNCICLCEMGCFSSRSTVKSKINLILEYIKYTCTCITALINKIMCQQYKTIKPFNPSSNSKVWVSVQKSWLLQLHFSKQPLVGCEGSGIQLTHCPATYCCRGGFTWCFAVEREFS